MKVLIVDDDPDAITFLSAWLEDHGHEACSASDGQSGLEAAAAERPDLILLDVRMPNRTGAQLYREIKASESLSRIPVIFISGVEKPDFFGEDCSPLPPPAAFIPKPIDFEALRAAIERVRG